MVFSIKKSFSLLIFFLFLHISCLFSQSHSVYFIGDAGKDTKPGKTLLTLKAHIEKDSNSTLVFLGDNSYPIGVKAKGLEMVDYPYAHPAAAYLVSQLCILKKYRGNVFFVPGNHDWKAQKTRGALQSILNEELIVNAYVTDSTRIKNVREHTDVFIWGSHEFKRKFGMYDLNESLTIILFDSQFYFQKISGITGKQKSVMLEELMLELEERISEKEKEGRKIIIASHHPVFTNGSHSRFRQPLRFLFNWTPFYFLGKLGVNRWLSQDIDQPKYEKYRNVFLKLLEKHSGIYFLAGHDHNLQYISETDDHHIVSGAGSKSNKLRKKKRFGSYFDNDKKKGFVKLTFNESRECKVSFISEDDEILFEK